MPRRRKPGLTKKQQQVQKDHIESIQKMTLFNKPVVRRSQSTPTYKSHSQQDVLQEDRNKGRSFKSNDKFIERSLEQFKYEGEMLKRELAAQKEADLKKKRVGITFNKGAYQYLGDDIDPTTLGK
jgi:hypothetical protein